MFAQLAEKCLEEIRVDSIISTKCGLLHVTDLNNAAKFVQKISLTSTILSSACRSFLQGSILPRMFLAFRISLRFKESVNGSEKPNALHESSLSAWEMNRQACIIVTGQ